MAPDRNGPDRATADYQRHARAMTEGHWVQRGLSAEGITLFGGLTPELDRLAVEGLEALRSEGDRDA